MDTQSNAAGITLYSLPDVAERLSISVRQVYNLISRGDLRPVDLGSGGRSKTRIRSDDLGAYIDSRTRSVPVRAVS